MDENRSSDRVFMAPGAASGGAMRLPGASEGWPPLDDHLVEPEVSRDEVVGGRWIKALPANPPHADRHTDLDYVIRGSVAEGYVSSTDLLTRSAVDSDFATDVSVRKAGVNPEAGERYLEEVAFEVVNEQRLKDMTERAKILTNRGVRRIFAIFAKKGEVAEWSPSWNRWKRLGAKAKIRDRCFEVPVPVKALLDAVEADNAVLEGLVARGNPALRARDASRREEGREEGRKEGWEEGRKKGREEGRKVGWEEGRARARAEAVLTVLAARGVPVSDVERERILACRQPAVLERWIARAAVVEAAAELFERQ
jgi:hypothetical protein